MLLIFSNLTSGQAIHGKVRDSLTHRLIVGAVVEFTQGKWVTDNQGEFTVSVPEGIDTLKLTHRNYRTLQVDISEHAVDYTLYLYMHPKAIQIEEVVVTDSSPINQAGNLEFKLGLLPPPKHQQYFVTPSQRTSYRQGASTSRLITIDLLTIGRWLFKKERNREKNLEDTAIEWDQADALVTKTFIGEITGLEGDSLQIFQNIYRLSPKQIHSMGEYDIRRYIQEKAKEFRKR